MSTQHGFMVGQRVIVGGDEIRTVTYIPARMRHERSAFLGVWCQSIDGSASCYDPKNVKPLPNGQL